MGVLEMGGASSQITLLPEVDPMQWRIQDFPLGGHRAIGGHQPPMWVLFSENICKNERIGSCWGGGGVRWRHPPRSANALADKFSVQVLGKDYATYTRSYLGYAQDALVRWLDMELPEHNPNSDLLQSPCMLSGKGIKFRTLDLPIGL